MAAATAKRCRCNKKPWQLQRRNTADATKNRASCNGKTLQMQQKTVATATEKRCRCNKKPWQLQRKNAADAPKNRGRWNGKTMQLQHIAVAGATEQRCTCNASKMLRYEGALLFNISLFHKWRPTEKPTPENSFLVPSCFLLKSFIVACCVCINIRFAKQVIRFFAWISSDSYSATQLIN